MTSNDAKREPGYPGALPPRGDRLARPWILIVIGIFVLIMVLPILGIPSRFIPEATPVPLPSLPPPSGSVAPTGSGSVAPLPSASVSASPSASVAASASAADQ